MKKNSTIWLCDNCGNEFLTWSGKCSMCGSWNTLKEFTSSAKKGKSSVHTEQASPQKISDIKFDASTRITTKISELDRVLGGGIVPGSVVLLGGEPGIGKSTLLLQLANNLRNVFYLSAEESTEQIKMRAERLGVKNTNIILFSGWDIENILREVERIKPDLFIVDSIQTISYEAVEGTAGSMIQVRECGILLQQFAKSKGIPIVIIGHVTKDGSLAGPRILEHLVDTVLYLEGERFGDARILRGVKNRFGATNEVGIFSMQQEGLVEINNPSELFLSERNINPGSVITVVLEGTRPMLVEIQALCLPTHFGYPKRTSSGFDLNRLNLLIAVISKKTKINLSNHDVFLNVVGGIKINEPAADLAIIAAIISSFYNKNFDKNLVFVGEVGLLGEVRKVIRQEDRKKEAKNFGYNIAEKIKNISEISTLLF